MKLGLLVILLHIIGGTLYQTISFRNYRDFLAEVYKQNFGFTDWEYINQITSFMSIHVNNQYFNINTFLMFTTLSIFIAIVIHLLKNNKSLGA
ncbi:hypothetical protein SM124_19965 [Bacillus sp. 31A1R]|uniref:DUF4306 domain-containing protein n=1 Tax=Robertmurraya mangrovi TaxID=3098077 RepID=A0ABU5J3T9_9BACI|nr:hypothetical protein [Bacillus sp. 31A1R]